jgi:hypothetical protein
MSRRLCAATAAFVFALAAAGSIRAVDAPGTLSVTTDRTQISTRLGHKFAFRTTIANTGPAPARELIAHLNVLSFDSSVYVDPEDWSSHRTNYLSPIPAGGSRTVTWRVQAVNPGRFAVYVAVLPRSGSAPPVTGPTIDVTVAKRTTLNPHGVVPLALGVPALLGLLMLGVRMRRRAR